MTAPSVSVRSGGGSGGTATTSHSITLPASGVNTGDLLMVFFSVSGAPTCTASSGWIKYMQDDQEGILSAAIFYKWATGSDTCTITTSSAQQSTHKVLCVPNGGVPNADMSWGDSINSDPPAVYTFQSDDYLVIASRHGAGTVVATAAPSGFSNLITQTASTTSGASTNTAERAVTITAAPTGSFDPGVFTSATADWLSATVFIPSSVVMNQIIIDDFPGPSIDTTKWDISTPSGTSASISSGQVRLTVNSGVTAYAELNYKVVEAMPAGRLYGAKMIATGATDVASAQTFLAADSSNGGGWWYVESTGSNNDELQVSASDGIEDLVDWAPIPPAATYLAVGRWPNGDLVWAYSPDGTHWRRHTSQPWAFDTQAITLMLSHGHYATESSGTTAIFDTFSRFDVPSTGPTHHVRRGGVTVAASDVKVRRGGVWVTPTAIKVRRGGVWVTPV